MANITNTIIIGGQEFALGGDIPVINFKENLEYSFIDPVGGQCGGGGDTGGGPSIPGVSVPGTGGGGGGGARRRHSSRRGLRDWQEMPWPERQERMKDDIQMVVLHHDATYHSHACFGVLCARGLSTHFMVNFNGGVIQGMDPVWVAFHVREFNNVSIGIDMNNIATVEGHQNRYSDPAFGTVVDYAEREVVEGRINRSLKQSFAYTEEQYVSLAAILKVLHDVIDLPLIYPMSEAGGDVLRTRLSNPNAFRGFLGHWHVQAGKWDPGPGFDWAHVMELLHGEANHWPVDLGTAALKDLASQQMVDEATNTYYENNEQGPGGGTFPIGLNQQWHDGVHLYFPETGAPVYCVAKGRILMVRNGPTFPIGSPNYVVVQHDTERERLLINPDGTSEIISDNLRWYTLYMHLKRMDHQLVPAERAAVEEEEGSEEGEEGEEGEAEGEEGGGPSMEIESIVTEDGLELPAWFVTLVRLARQSTGGLPLEVRPDISMDDFIGLGAEDFFSRAFALLRPQDISNARECIEDGNPYKFVENPDDPEQGIPVQAGEIIGYVGEFGELAGNDVVKRPMIHFQIFALSPIFDDTRFDTEVWRRVQADLSGNTLCSVDDLLAPIRTLSRGDQEAPSTIDIGRGRTLTPSEINRFYRSGPGEERHAFRSTIAVHLSEWDIANEDNLTADVPILWPWQTEQEYLRYRAHHIGFKWINDETRDLLGMLEGPVPIYTYHPIYLLGWWALNFGRAVNGQAFDGLEGDELEQALLEEQRQCEENPEDPGCIDDGHGLVDISEMRDYPIEYEEFEGEDNGEWQFDLHLRDPFEG